MDLAALRIAKLGHVDHRLALAADLDERIARAHRDHPPVNHVSGARPRRCLRLAGSQQGGEVLALVPVVPIRHFHVPKAIRDPTDHTPLARMRQRRMAWSDATRRRRAENSESRTAAGELARAPARPAIPEVARIRHSRESGKPGDTPTGLVHASTGRGAGQHRGRLGLPDGTRSLPSFSTDHCPVSRQGTAASRPASADRVATARRPCLALSSLEDIGPGLPRASGNGKHEKIRGGCDIPALASLTTGRTPYHELCEDTAAQRAVIPWPSALP